MSAIAAITAKKNNASKSTENLWIQTRRRKPTKKMDSCGNPVEQFHVVSAIKATNWSELPCSGWFPKTSSCLSAMLAGYRTPPPKKNRKVSIAKSDYLCFLRLDVVSRRPTAESRTKWQPHWCYPTLWSAESFLNTRIRSCLIIYIIYQRCLDSNISNLY